MPTGNVWDLALTWVICCIHLSSPNRYTILQILLCVSYKLWNISLWCFLIYLLVIYQDIYMFYTLCAFYAHLAPHFWINQSLVFTNPTLYLVQVAIGRSLSLTSNQCVYLVLVSTNPRPNWPRPRAKCLDHSIWSSVPMVNTATKLVTPCKPLITCSVP